jgi:hypothetical protein
MVFQRAPQGDKSFLVLFFKKEHPLLRCYPPGIRYLAKSTTLWRQRPCREMMAIEARAQLFEIIEN